MANSTPEEVRALAVELLAVLKEASKETQACVPGYILRLSGVYQKSLEVIARAEQVLS